MQVTPLWYHKTLGAYDKFIWLLGLMLFHNKDDVWLKRTFIIFLNACWDMDVKMKVSVFRGFSRPLVSLCNTDDQMLLFCHMSVCAFWKGVNLMTFTLPCGRCDLWMSQMKCWYLCCICWVAGGNNTSVPPGRRVQCLAGSPPDLMESIQQYCCRIWEQCQTNVLLILE